MRRWLIGMLMLAMVAGLVAGGTALWWLHRPMGMAADRIDLSIDPGTTPRAVAREVVRAGAQVQPDLLFAWFRLSGQDRLIKAGSYEIERGTTPHQLLQQIVQGDQALRAITLVEGWNIRQVRDALAKAPDLRPDTRTLAADALMAQLGRPGVHPEGRFFPDTYAYAKGSSDADVLRRALRAMDRKLDSAWAQRAANSPLRSADEALVLASIVEKETGKAADRGQIAGVFANRLRIGMLLQTDPTVIYGLGAAFDGNLRRRDLQADTPYNPYKRPGLPPTPIAMPGREALLAAVQPASTRALYFVARGDGTSQFSETLDAHNRAVQQYQLGR